MNNLSFEQAKVILTDFRDKSFTEILLSKIPDFYDIICLIFNTIEKNEYNIELSSDHIRTLIDFYIYVAFMIYKKGQSEEFFNFIDAYIITLSNFSKFLTDETYKDLNESIYVLEVLYKSKENYETLIFLSNDIIDKYNSQFHRASNELSIRFIQSFLKEEQDDY